MAEVPEPMPLQDFLALDTEGFDKKLDDYKNHPKGLFREQHSLELDSVYTMNSDMLQVPLGETEQVVLADIVGRHAKSELAGSVLDDKKTDAIAETLFDTSLSTARRWHKKKYPHLYGKTTAPVLPPPQAQVADSAAGSSQRAATGLSDEVATREVVTHTSHGSGKAKEQANQQALHSSDFTFNTFIALVLPDTLSRSPFVKMTRSSTSTSL